MAERKNCKGKAADIGSAAKTELTQTSVGNRGPAGIALVSTTAGIALPLATGVSDGQSLGRLGLRGIPLEPVIPDVPDIQYGRPMHASTTQIVSAIVYERIENDAKAGIIDGARHAQALAEARLWNPNILRDLPQLRQYDQAIKIIGRRYRHLRFHCTISSTIPELKDIFESHASHIAFSGGLITFDGIAFVIIVTAQMVSECVRAGHSPATYGKIIQSCLDYFSIAAHHACDNMTVDEFISSEGSGQLNGWITIIAEARMHLDVLIPEIPAQSRIHPVDDCPNCGHDRMLFRHNDQRPNAQCPFCCTFWCLFQECKFSANSTTDLILHQRRYHRYPHRTRTTCNTCFKVQPNRTNYRSATIRCGCSSVWCVFDDCNQNFNSCKLAKAHQKAIHPKLHLCGECMIGIKNRNLHKRFDTCTQCGKYWCFIGQCSVEEDTPSDIIRHQRQCDYGV